MELDKIQDSKFTGFIKPVLNLIDNGVIYRKGFWVLYLLNAIASLLIPLILLIYTIGSGILSYSSFGIVLGLILVWLCFAFSGWLGFQVFWNRMKKIDTLLKEDCDFVAIPLLADYIKTSGEFIGIVTVSLVPCLVLLGIVATDIAKNIVPLADSGIALVFVSVLIGIQGYIIMLVAKFFSESITAFASIANNTKNLAKSTNE
jgi:hypothetical protein